MFEIQYTINFPHQEDRIWNTIATSPTIKEAMDVVRDFLRHPRSHHICPKYRITQNNKIVATT
jgi:hypothetical protein